MRPSLRCCYGDFADRNEITVAGHDNNVSGACRHAGDGDRVAANGDRCFCPVGGCHAERGIRGAGRINRHIERCGCTDGHACRGFIERDAGDGDIRAPAFFSQLRLAGVGDFRCAGNNLFCRDGFTQAAAPAAENVDGTVRVFDFVIAY